MEQWEQQLLFVGKLIISQKRFANERGLKLYDPRVGICHNVIAKEKAKGTKYEQLFANRDKDLSSGEGIKKFTSIGQ